MSYSATFISSINQVDQDTWNRIADTSYPFIRHEFLSALENSGAVSAEAGWQAQHVLVYHHQQLVAFMPAYLKSHSYGEYVFDHAWADAYRRYGIAYYPKWVSAIPFTPVSGSRLCVAEGFSEQDVFQCIAEYVNAQCTEHGWSSWHILFSAKPDQALFSSQPLMLRKAVHFQWFNQGCTCIDDFLALFSSRKRKNVKKERKKIVEQGITLERLTGEQLTPEIFETFYVFYQMTYAKRSGHTGYLNHDFFRLLTEAMPESIVLVMAKREGRYIAGALNFKDQNTLYGRYWGCTEEHEHLHFEACYYQGIEYCIEQGLERFDPGVQGEHKIQRGFIPVRTFSWHWLQREDFRQAIVGFLAEEERHVAQYTSEVEQHLPFKAPTLSR